MSVLAFLGGMGSGYLAQKEKNRQNEREDTRDAMYAQRFAWEKDDAERKKQDRANADALEQAQMEEMSAGTATPEHAVEHQGADGQTVSVPQPSAGDAEFTAFMQNAAKPEGATNYPETKVAQNYSVRMTDGTKKTFTGLDAAKQAADYTKANPVSEIDRLNAASRRLRGMRGGFQRAMELQQQAIAAENLQIQRDKYAKELQNENVFDALRFANTGNAQGVYDAFNKSGLYKFEAVPKLTKVMRDVKGLGKIATYDIEGTVVDKNGNKQPFKNNNFDMGMSLLPYMDSIKTQAALNAAGDKSEYNANLLKLRQEGLATQQYLGQLRAETARANKAATSQVDLKDLRNIQHDYLTRYGPKVNNAGEINPADEAAFRERYLDATNLLRSNGERGMVFTAPELEEIQRITTLARSDPKLELIDYREIPGTDLVEEFVNIGDRMAFIGVSKHKTSDGNKK